MGLHYHGTYISSSPSSTRPSVRPTASTQPRSCRRLWSSVAVLASVLLPPSPMHITYFYKWCIGREKGPSRPFSIFRVDPARTTNFSHRCFPSSKFLVFCHRFWSSRPAVARRPVFGKSAPSRQVCCRQLQSLELQPQDNARNRRRTRRRRGSDAIIHHFNADMRRRYSL